MRTTDLQAHEERDRGGEGEGELGHRHDAHARSDDVHRRPHRIDALQRHLPISGWYINYTVRCEVFHDLIIGRTSR